MEIPTTRKSKKTHLHTKSVGGGGSSECLRLADANLSGLIDNDSRQNVKNHCCRVGQHGGLWWNTMSTTKNLSELELTPVECVCLAYNQAVDFTVEQAVRNCRASALSGEIHFEYLKF